MIEALSPNKSLERILEGAGAFCYTESPYSALQKRSILSLGTLIGGIPGAIISGIGAVTSNLACEYLDRKSIEHWATYFVK